ncbi:MAG: DUF3105 domain-containing protein [Thermocrispum sp.]
MRLRSVMLFAAGLLAVAGCEGTESGTPTGGTDGQPPVNSAPPQTSNTAPPVSDPKQIEGIRHVEYRGGLHIKENERVDYQQQPPFGGAHDPVWAACDGVVYQQAVRNEHMVHSLEHGAVWIAYNPDRVDQAGVSALSAKVTGRPYTMMSPYPGLDQPISLQSWGFQLKVSDPADPRIDQFIDALRQNQETTPEPNAPCSAVGGFDPRNPPPFDPSDPGPSAVPDTPGG